MDIASYTYSHYEAEARTFVVDFSCGFALSVESRGALISTCSYMVLPTII